MNDQPAEPTLAQLQAAKTVGANPYFRIVASMDPEAVEVSKNHVGRKLARSTDPDNPSYAEVHEMIETSGDFVSALAEGDLAEALYRADMVNMRLLVRTFDRDLMLAELADDRGSVESAERWLDPNIERYGFGGE